VTDAPAPALLPPVSIVEAMDDPHLFGPWFREDSWRAWRAFLAAVFALPMSEAELALYRECTGRQAPPAEPQSEAWLIVGRRGGKSRILALIAVYLATFRDYSAHLAPGERAGIVVLAADKGQARNIFQYAEAMLREVDLLAGMLRRAVIGEIELTNGLTIEIATSSYKTVRGRTIVAALGDEVAFWQTDEGGANPDVEILNALRPAMATIPGSMLLCGSSPYARRGVLWDAMRRFFGREDAPALVWKAATRVMNPSVEQAFVDAEYERDPAAAAAEYGAEFRTDVAAFIAREVVEARTVEGRHELPPLRDGVRYVAFTDPSGGSSDSMTLAIAHFEKGIAVLDAVREVRPPFSPNDVVVDFAELLQRYGLMSVEGDRYGAAWVQERFRMHGITYEPSEKTKSDIYRELMPLMNSGEVALLDLPRLSAQLCALERRTARGGRDSVDHPPGGHDDVANAAAGALVKAARGRSGIAIWEKLVA
jgi:hypothetical protein